MTSRLLDELAGRELIDGAEEFAQLVPIEVTCKLLGVRWVTDFSGRDYRAGRGLNSRWRRVGVGILARAVGVRA